MKSVLMLLCAAAALAAGCSSGPSKPARSGGSVYVLKAHEFEGCECDSVCPCLFQKDTSHGDCKVLMAWSISEGHYKGTDLAGVNFAVAITKSGANMEKNLGKWTGVLYHSDKSSEAQKVGVTEILKAELGGAFEKLEVKTAPIAIKRNGDHHELTLGTVGSLKIAGIKNQAGAVMAIENVPSPIAPPKVWCGLSEVNTYADGPAKWDLKGRNALYAEFEMASKQ